MTTIREVLSNNTGFVRANSEQLERLLQIVVAANADIKQYADATPDFASQFNRAFFAVGHAFRRKEPDKS